MKIGLLGHGVVGSGVCRIIDAHKTPQTAGLTVEKILVRTEQEKNDVRCTTSADEILDDPQIDVICECMGGIEPAFTYAKRAIMNGKSFVSSNKKMLASHLEELVSLAEENHVFLCLEASCGGGIPWMNNLRRIKRIDEITSFRGIFNGTTNYILYSMKQNGTSFEEALKQAQQLGYAERDPSDDIDGLDVCYKTMLSCAQGLEMLIDENEIPVFGIRNISAADIAWAARNDRTIKLIGKGGREKDAVYACVIPCALKDSDYLAQIPDNLNGLECVSTTLNTAGFIGQGAGSLPTAHAVVQDLIDLEMNEAESGVVLQSARIDNSCLSASYYIRSKNIEAFAGVTRTHINSDAVVTEKITIETVRNLLQASADPSAFVMEVSE